MEAKKTLYNLASNLLSVDLRVLGVFRVLLGLMCFIDILRRFPYIEIFYSDNGVAPNHFMAEISGRYSSKAFTLLSSFGSTGEITFFFIFALIFSFFLMIGYKTKLSHVITIVTVLSIHNRLIILENGADMVYNNLLIWSVFLPLGSRISIDRLFLTLRSYKDSTVESLNTGILVSSNESSRYWGIAYFACLLQLSVIYFFNYINKTGNTWEQGTSIYYFYQLDNFLTPFGNFVKEFNLMPLQFSKVLTYSTIYLEMLAPLLILAPFITTRRIAFTALVGFHFIIGISLNVGMFSWIMIAYLFLLLSSKDIELIKKLLSRLSGRSLLVFYDSDCGFCHQTARIIRRIDIFSSITWVGREYHGQRPSEAEDLKEESIVVLDNNTGSVSTHHLAFSDIISALPFGLLVSWIFRLPGVSNLSLRIYNLVSRNRTSISNYFGYSACDVPNKNEPINPIFKREIQSSDITKIVVFESFKTILVCILILAMINYASTKNDGYKEWRKENGYESIKTNYNYSKISKRLRMTQKWNMFSPSTPKSFSWVVLEATLYDESKIDLLSGKAPVYDKLDYNTYRMVDHSQFWRKYLGRISKKNNKKYRPQLKNLILSSKNPIKPFDDLNQDGAVNIKDKIKSIELYKVSKSIANPLLESHKKSKVRKIKIDLDASSKSVKRPIRKK